MTPRSAQGTSLLNYCSLVHLFYHLFFFKTISLDRTINFEINITTTMDIIGHLNSLVLLEKIPFT